MKQYKHNENYFLVKNIAIQKFCFFIRIKKDVRLDLTGIPILKNRIAIQTYLRNPFEEIIPFIYPLKILENSWGIEREYWLPMLPSYRN